MAASYDQLRRCTVAVDFGAAMTRVYVKQSGLVVDEASIAAVNTRTGALVAAGQAAERMSGRTPPYIKIARPISNGTVVDIQMAQRMLRAVAGDKLRRSWRRNPMLRAAVCVPHGADPLVRRAAVETLAGMGARRVEPVDTLVAVGVGCGLPVQRPEATMIVMCGAEASQIAVLSLGSIVAAAKVPVGGETIEHAVVQHLRHRHELILPSRAVRKLCPGLTVDVPSAPTTVHGRDVTTGLVRSVELDPQEIQAVMNNPLTGVADAIRDVLHRCPPDLVADLADHGITLAGGSALLPGLDERLRQATGMSMRIAPDPATAAVNGVAAMIEGKVQPLHMDPSGNQGLF